MTIECPDCGQTIDPNGAGMIQHRAECTGYRVIGLKKPLTNEEFQKLVEMIRRA